MAGPADILVNAIADAPDTSKAFATTFNAIAGARQDAMKNRLRLMEIQNSAALKEQNLQSQTEMLPVKQQLLQAQADLARVRASSLPAESEARVKSTEALTQIRLGRIQDENERNNQLTALNAAINSTVDGEGRSLRSRLADLDPKVRSAAAEEAYSVLAKFGDSPFKEVQAQLRDYTTKYPEIALKQQLAVQQAQDREARIADKSRHEGNMEQIAQQNADSNTQRANAAAAKAGAPTDGGLILTVPNLGKMPLDTVRRVLARGMDPKASEKEKQDAAALKAGVLSIPSGQRDENTGNAIPRYSLKDVSNWAMEGERQGTAKAPPATPAVPAGSKPSGGVVPQQPVATPVPTRPAGAKPSAADVLGQFGIPTSSAGDGGDVAGFASNDAEAIPLSSLPDISSIPSLTQIPGLFGQQQQAPGWGGLQPLA